jgi:hypothetical protein
MPLERKLQDVFDARQRYTQENNKCVDIPGHECVPDYELPDKVETNTQLVGSKPESRIASRRSSEPAIRTKNKRTLELEKDEGANGHQDDEGPQ